jgi:hypothetical protein
LECIQLLLGLLASRLLLLLSYLDPGMLRHQEQQQQQQQQY